MLSENEDNTISGYTIAESNLAENSSKIGSAVFAVKGSGTIQRSLDENLVRLSFKDSKTNGISIVNAKLSKDGTVLEGTSDQSFVVKVGKNLKSAKVSYKWIATKSDVK